MILLCKSVLLKLTSLQLNEKSKEVCINSRSTLASSPLLRQVTQHTIVKWPIYSQVDIIVFVPSVCQNTVGMQGGSVAGWLGLRT